MKQFNKLFLTTLFVLVCFSLMAQHKFFTDVNESNISIANAKRTIIPQKYRTVSVNTNDLKAFLWSLPSDRNPFNRSQAPVMELPMPDGSSARFRVWESSIQERGLEAKFPEIKTFEGQGIDDPYASIRFDYTDFGFHAQIISVHGNIYLDPYARGNINDYISYYNHDNIREDHWTCGVTENLASRSAEANAATAATGPCRGTQLYTFRLAVACTGEYAQAVGGTTAALLHSAIVTTVNRVVGVYITELSIKMILIANNNVIEYLNPSTDPFTGNNNANTLIGESQTVINGNIGSANYDVGHTFSTGGGGLSDLGVVCKSNSKAMSITGSPTPTGDGYDIDYVAHEMGHAFGANHPFNSTTSNCGGGNRNASTAYEVGSGTTIMAYAGICGSDDIQPHSDPYFHTISFDEISTYMSGNGGTCAVITATGNTLPQITSMSNNSVSIPVSTPFTLTAAATDADADAITYNWEEWDLGAATTWNGGATSTTSPVFKSRIPKTSGSRTFPDISFIAANYVLTSSDLAGTTMDGNKGETLPTVARTMKFRLTVRDNRAGGGGVVTGGNGCQSGFTGVFQVTTVAGSPFAVTAPNGGESWAGNSTHTITWNVVGTTAAPFNVANVKISLSTDGGLTYPTVLSSSTANDGTEALVIPNTPTTTARIKVEAIGNIFFDISNANFTITAGTSFSTITTSAISPLTYCAGAAVSVPFTTNGAANAGNVFTAQLSNASGSFASPVAIGTLTSTAAGTVPATIPAATTAGTGYRIRVVSSNPVVTGSDNGSNIGVNVVPTASVITAGGSTTFCAGGSVVLSGNSTGGTWSVGGGSAATLTATTSGDYFVTTTNSCGSVTSNHITVTVNPLPTVSFSGLASSYAVNAASATLTGSPAGGTFSGPGISGSVFSPAAAGVGGPYTITYTYSNANGCVNSSSHQTTVTGTCTVPARPGTITTVGGTAKVCPGDVKTYSIVAVSGATSYTWTPPTGGVVTNGQNTLSATITYNSGFTVGDSLRVTANNTCGSSIARALKINRNAAASEPSVITGQAIGVCNSSSIPYSVTNVAGDTYAWSWSVTSATIPTGQGTNSITANFLSSFVSGKLMVTASNACGTSSARSLTVYARPGVPVITGATTVCPDQQGVPYSLTPLNNASSYTWYVPTGSHISDGTTTSTSTTLTTTATSVTVNFGNNAGPIRAKGNNACAASSVGSLTVAFGTCKESAPGIAADVIKKSGIVQVYPNPSNGAFRIILNNAQTVSTAYISIVNEFGQVIYQADEKCNNGIIDMKAADKLTNGIYFVNCTVNGVKTVSKLMISK